MDIAWKLDDKPLLFSLTDSKSFSFTLKPLLTTQYKLAVSVLKGEESYSDIMEFTVYQFPFVGTWKATDVESPAHEENVDVVGVWRLDNFELYYLERDNETKIKTFSAKGNMDFPVENEWFQLTETHYYEEEVSSWQDWPGPENFWAKYNYVDGKSKMTVSLDMELPPDTEEYIWNFIKISDAIDPWFD